MRDRKSDAHRPTLASKLGRPIKPGHDADHLDGDKDNNDPANLQELEHGAHAAKSNSERGLNQLRTSLRMVQKKEKLY